MARPKKIGLEYFPLDCQMDDKVEMLEAEHGLVGFAVYLKLLQHIYQTENAELDMSIVFRWKTLGKQLEMTIEMLQAHVETMFQVGLFDRAAYTERQMLTSNGIQKRREKVTGLREKDRSRKADAHSDSTASFPDGKPTENGGKGKEKGKNTNVFQKETLTEVGGGAQKKIGGENSAPETQATAPTPPPVAKPPQPFGRDPEAFPPQLTLPFDSPAFRTAWVKWRRYRAEIDKAFRGDISEQADLDKCGTLAAGSELTALKIIDDTISSNWKNLILHTQTHGSSHRRNPGPAAAAGRVSNLSAAAYTGGRDRSSSAA